MRLPAAVFDFLPSVETVRSEWATHPGDYLVAAQAEYRWNVWRRLGFVGFVGVATVFESINEADDGTLFPGGGAGVRFTAFTDNHMNVGLDAAVGDGDWGIYFRIGEAF